LKNTGDVIRFPSAFAVTTRADAIRGAGCPAAFPGKAATAVDSRKPR